MRVCTFHFSKFPELFFFDPVVGSGDGDDDNDGDPNGEALNPLDFRVFAELRRFRERTEPTSGTKWGGKPGNLRVHVQILKLGRRIADLRACRYGV